MNQMRNRRRRFLLGAGALIVARAAHAQQAQRQFRVGVLHIGASAGLAQWIDSFVSGLQDRGYEPGRNLVVDRRGTDSFKSALAAADELIALKPDVLAATEVTGFLLKSKTSTIPIVLLNSADPVAAGLVKSLARPGTNVTGMSYSMFELVSKQLELLSEIAPNMGRVALLTGPFDPPKDSPFYGRPDDWELALRRAAEAKGLAPIVARAGDPSALQKAFEQIRAERAGGVVVATNSLLLHMHEEVTSGLRRMRLPAVSGYGGFVFAGGLLSYGPSYVKTYRYAAKFVDLILKGTKPADLPVEQISQFELLVNRKSAQELGLKVPQSILLRTDQVVE